MKKGFLFILLCLCLLLSSCGGGGGAGGASIPDSEYTTHNPKGWGGGGNSGGAGGSSNWNGGNYSSGVTLQGGTPLSVTGYSYKGQTYPDVTSLTNAMQAYGAPYDVTFTLAGGETRTARVTKTSEGFLFEHQYKATYIPPGGNGPQPVFYYKNDGISLPLPPVADDLYAEVNGVWYHANGYTVNGNSYPAGSTIPVAPDSGDMDLGTIGTAPDTSTYGFRTSDNTLVVNQTSGTVVINNAGGKTFETVELPSSAANGSISLDFSGVTGFSLIGDDGGGPNLGQPAITNGAKLGSVTLPDTDFSLGFGAFKDCPNLSSLDLSHCTSLDIWALQNCTGLSTVDLSHCTTIGEYALEGCSGVTGNIDLSGYTGSTIKGVFKDCGGITGVTLPAAITTIDESTFLNCSNLSNINLSNVIYIGQSAFYNCSSLSSVNLSNITGIGNYAFQNCSSLSSVDLSQVTSIGENAFSGCTGISGTINLSECSNVGTNAFYCCSGITSVTGLKGDIGAWAFYGTGITGPIDFQNVTSIGANAFNSCGLSGTINLSSCLSIGDSAFQDCTEITDVTNLGGSVGDYAFNGCTGLTGTTIDLSDVTSVGSAAFSGCYISGSLDLSSCTTIGPDAFASCVGVTGITIGSNVTSIGTMAFYSCGTCAYTFLKDPNTILYGAGSAIYSGATATWTDNGTTHTYTWNSGTAHWDAPLIGTKSAPDSVGDIVFSDGSASPTGTTLTPAQQAAAVAVIFSTSGGKVLGVGLEEELKSWAPTASPGNSISFSTSFDDGSGNWEVITYGDTTGSLDAATNYPAFDWCNNYGVAVNGETSGWYLPAYTGELLVLYNNKDTVNASISSIGGSYVQLGSSGLIYWSSSQDTTNASTDNMAWRVSFEDGNAGSSNKNLSNRTRAIRRFN